MGTCDKEKKREEDEKFENIIATIRQENHIFMIVIAVSMFTGRLEKIQIPTEKICEI